MYSYLSSIICCSFFIIMYFLLIELKYSTFKTIFLILSCSALSVAVFLFLISKDYPSTYSSILSLTIPSFIFFGLLSKHKDSRFIFTFCSLDILGMITSYLVELLTNALNLNNIFYFVTLTAIYIFIILVSKKHKKTYLKLQEDITKGWRSLATISILFYMMLYILTGYPTPIEERPEYTPIVVLFCLTILLVYIVVFQDILHMKRNYEFKVNQQLLQAQIDLQNSQLKVQSLYYRLANIDTLTGLKNRNAFELRKEELETSWTETQNISCLSLDINNLKIVNDRLGHHKGDELIKNLAHILTKVFEDDGDVYRIGGDEFLTFFCHTPISDVYASIEKFKKSLNQHNLTHNIKIEVAMGLSNLLDDSSLDLPSLIDMADKNMYKDKRYLKSIAK